MKKVFETLCILWYHTIPSLKGWLVFAQSHPRSAVSLLAKRLFYTLTRRMIGSWTDSFGFIVNSPEMLVSYWSIFVERNLSHESWVKTIAAVSSPCVIDVGANAGVFVHFIHTLNTSAEILAVEPQECLAKRISDYANERKASIRSIAAACSDHTGRIALYLNQDGDTSASLSPDYIVAHSRSVMVPLITLDQIAPPGEIFLLKVDAEGHDLEVLTGAGQALKRTRHLLVELHPGKSIAAVTGMLGENWDTVRLGVIDYLFINQNLSAIQNAIQASEVTARRTSTLTLESR